MPIRPENRGRYGPDWSAFSDAIRFGRAGGRCECSGQCGRPAQHLAADGRCARCHGDPITRLAAMDEGAEPTIEIATGVVVLTVAHLCHTPECRVCVLAMCQGCHLHYDRGHHRDSAARSRDAAAGQLALIDRPVVRCPFAPAVTE